jgi:hypothetical protein
MDFVLVRLARRTNRDRLRPTAQWLATRQPAAALKVTDRKEETSRRPSYLRAPRSDADREGQFVLTSNSALGAGTSLL